MLFNFQIKIMLMNSYFIIPNPNKKWAIKLSNEMELFLKTKGYVKSNSNAQITIIIGGDGSFYYNLKKIKGKVLLIGSESTYRSQLKRTNWKSKILKLIERNKTIKLPLLSVYKNKKLFGEGVNDIVFHSKDFKVSDFSIKLKNKKIKYRGDGLIVSTPFGSTAYSYSAGGSKLNLKSKKFILTPICPYLRVVKPTTFKQNDEVKINCDKVMLIIDGINICDCSGTYVISKSKNNIEYLI